MRIFRRCVLNCTLGQASGVFMQKRRAFDQYGFGRALACQKTGKTLLFICWDLCSIIIFNVGGRKIVCKQTRKEIMSGKGS